MVELHSQSKSSSPDLFKHYPNISEDEIPNDIPAEYYRQLCTLLPHLPPNKLVKDLVHAHRDASGNLVYGAPVQNRPWEWVENLGEPATEEDPHRWQQGPFKNASSLSLEHFAARRTGDHITQPIRMHDVHDSDAMRLEGDLRSFEDGLSAESVYRRDWRETRLEAYRDGEPDGAPTERLDEAGSLPIFATHNRSGSTGGSRRASPASSVKSRGSARGSSVRPSPGSTNRMSTVTMSDIVEEGTGSGVKRKAGSDNEVEIVEGPVPAKVDAKKPRGVKARGKRR